MLMALRYRWRRMRKAASEALHKNSAKSFLEYQSNESLRLARGLLQGSGDSKPILDLSKHLGRAAASIMFSCLYNESSVRSDAHEYLG